MASVHHRHGVLASTLTWFIAAAFFVGASLLSTPARALELQVNEVGGGPVGDFSYIVNVDNTGVPFDPDPDMHPSLHPMASYSPIVAAGDESTAGTILGANGQPLPPDRYLISVRAPGYKLWGAHVDTRPAPTGAATVSR